MEQILYLCAGKATLQLHKNPWKIFQESKEKHSPSQFVIETWICEFFCGTER